MIKVVPLLVLFAGLGSSPTVWSDPPAAPTNGLVLHFPFSGNTLDAGPLKNDGIPRGATLSSDRFGHAISALRLNGKGAYLETKRSLTDSESLTVSLWLSLDSWVQLDNWGAPQVIFFEGDDVGGHDVACYVMGGFHFTVKSNDVLSHANWLPPLHTWTHLVCVADSVGKTMAIWIDGEKVGEKPFSRGANVGFHAPFNLGRRPGGFNDWFLAGSFDEVRVYNRALTGEEIGNLYAVDAGRINGLKMDVETVRLTLNVTPGNSYILQSSSNMEAWADHGTAFVASTAEEQVSVNAAESGRFWRLVQAP